MPRWFLILFLLLSAFPSLNAQDKFKSSTYFGIHGGVNLSSVAFSPQVYDQVLLTSRNMGIVFRHISEPNIGFQAEFNLAGKGWEEKNDSVGTYIRRLETIDLPVTAAFVFGKKTFRFSFALGPYVSYLRDEKETIKINDPIYLKEYFNVPVENNWEFGFTGIVGFEFHTKLGVLGARSSYSHSLTTLFTPRGEKVYFHGSRNQVINIGLFYMIKL
ncbi:MAG: PorT family protein [Bacteroidales bacterium]|nr:PorT family protein [Bacteroidales bacterium]